MLEGEGFMASVCRSEPSVREDGQGLQEGSTDSRISVLAVSVSDTIFFSSSIFSVEGTVSFCFPHPVKVPIIKQNTNTKIFFFIIILFLY